MLAEALLAFFLSLSCICNSTSYHAKVTQYEAEALVQWRASLVSHSLPSWLISNHSSNNGPCEWDGIRCNIFGRVREINLANSNLSSTLHQFNFSIFTNLTSLDLNSNDLFGPSPYHIGSLSKLTTLDLGHNNFTGNIPNEIGELRELQVLYLYNNSLLGAIPRQLISNLQEVWDLDLSFNYLENPDPLMQFNNGSMASLTHLLLHHNSLGLEFPTFIFRCHKLIVLDLSYNNIAGSIPTRLSPNAFNQLESIKLSTNQFEGPIPDEISLLSNLESLVLSNNPLKGHIPPSIGNLSKLQDLVLRNTSPLPLSMTSLEKVSKISLYGNQLSGEIHSHFLSNWTQLTVLNLGRNNFSGTIPFEIGNLSNLLYLCLSENQISGSIPCSIGRLRNFKRLWLYRNQLSGSLPQEIGNLSNLWSIELFENQISGSLPSSIGRLRSLEELWLKQNQLSGSLPLEIGQLVNLRVLGMKANTLSGPLPSQIGHLSELVLLSLSENKISSPVPPEIRNLSQLEALYLDNNNFSGFLPVEIGCLSNLRFLTGKEFFQAWKSMRVAISSNESHLWNNVTLHCSLSIYSDFYAFVTVQTNKLETLDLSQNKLTGEIPNQLTGLTFLEVLNLSRNQLTGVIPHGKQFDTFSPDSYEGNPGLCGFPLSKQCEHVGANLVPLPTLDEEDAESSTMKIDWKFMLMGYGSGVGIRWAEDGFSEDSLTCSAPNCTCVSIDERKSQQRRNAVTGTQNSKHQHEWSSHDVGSKVLILSPKAQCLDGAYNIGVFGFKGTTKYRISIVVHGNSGRYINEQPSSSSSAVEAGSVECQNCRRYIPSRTIALHEAYCSRHNLEP
ncbi:hypothetical protein Syun_005804 [Stephania yunnanensis]|uniref:Leucine-rich repeat-containing N-terminal plant-type domain-containing protein n=1 Tax=Stephania yunnanensis TaxID=152371 RepID=A0AAP0KVF8_9MAGN